MHALTRRGFAAASLTALAALTACSSTADGGTDAASDAGGASDAGSTGAWPRTVAVGSRQVTLDAAPQRIVAVSTETGDLALQLVGAARVVGLPEGSTDPSSGNQVELARQVPDVVAGAPSPDPEQILSLEPDLVLITDRHDQEKSVAESLATSGVPCAQFTPSDFASPDAVAATITTMGGLLGAEEAAAGVVETLRAQVDEVESTVRDAPDAPRTLGLFARGGRLMMVESHSSTSTLVQLAGGTSIATEKGWDASPAADPEVLIDAAPDVILVQDFHGAGLTPFASLLESPALAQVPAVAQQRIELIDAMTTSGTAGPRLGEGLRQIAGILHPDLFPAQG